MIQYVAVKPLLANLHIYLSKSIDDLKHKLKKTQWKGSTKIIILNFGNYKTILPV